MQPTAAAAEGAQHAEPTTTATNGLAESTECGVYITFAQVLIQVGESTLLVADHYATSEWAVLFNQDGVSIGSPVFEGTGRTSWQVTGLEPGPYAFSITAKCRDGQEIAHTAMLQVDAQPTVASIISIEGTPDAQIEGEVVIASDPTSTPVAETSSASPVPTNLPVPTTIIPQPTASIDTSDDDGESQVMANFDDQGSGSDQGQGGTGDADLDEGGGASDQEAAASESSDTSWMVIIFNIFLWSLIAIIAAILIYIAWLRWDRQIRAYFARWKMRLYAMSNPPR